MYSNVCTLYELIGKCKQKCEVRKNLNEDARPFCIILIYCILLYCIAMEKRDRFPNKYLISNHWLSDTVSLFVEGINFWKLLISLLFPPRPFDRVGGIWGTGGVTRVGDKKEISRNLKQNWISRNANFVCFLYFCTYYVFLRIYSPKIWKFFCKKWLFFVWRPFRRHSPLHNSMIKLTTVICLPPFSCRLGSGHMLW